MWNLLEAGNSPTGVYWIRGPAELWIGFIIFKCGRESNHAYQKPEEKKTKFYQISDQYFFVSFWSLKIFYNKTPLAFAIDDLSCYTAYKYKQASLKTNETKKKPIRVTGIPTSWLLEWIWVPSFEMSKTRNWRAISHGNSSLLSLICNVSELKSELSSLKHGRLCRFLVANAGTKPFIFWIDEI